MTSLIEIADTEGFDRGVQHTVELLAKWLNVTDYEQGDGSEEHDTDLGNTLLNILAVKGLYDRDECEFATLPKRTAPESCPQCFNEADCSSIEVCRAVAEVCAVTNGVRDA